MSSLKNLFGSSSNVASTQSIMDKLAKDRQDNSKTVVEVAEVAEEEEEEDDDDDDDEEEKARVAKKVKRSRQNEDDLEGKYMAKLMKETEKEQEQQDQLKKEKTKENQQDGGEESSSDDDDDDEDVNKDDKSTTEEAKPATTIELKEKELEKAERTIFVGNLPLSVLKDKEVYKVFKKLFSSNPYKVGEEPEEEEEEKATTTTTTTTTTAAAAAAAAVDEQKNIYDIESIRFRSIAFSEPLPRKIAFSQLKLDEKRDSLNGYIVYKNKNVKKLNKFIKFLNGHVFENHHLRVDSITHPSIHDKKRSIFVGNLDFEEVEESLWKHFSKVGKIEYVRIIRDSKTNMGKGFAYVQFIDSSDVNKALMLHDKPISVSSAKKLRKLRISRCKSFDKKNNNNNNNSNTSKSNDYNNKDTSNLNNQQKTKMGRAQRVLGKMDKKSLGKELTIEGERAVKINKNVTSVLGKRKRKPRSKDSRAAMRSAAHKQKLAGSSAKK